MKKSLHLPGIYIIATLTCIHNVRGEVTLSKAKPYMHRAQKTYCVMDKAIKSGKRGLVATLIQQNSHLRQKKNLANYYQKLFHRAAEYCDVVIVNMFLSAGVDKNITDEDGRTPLHIAAANGHTAVIDRLLTVGAHQDALDRDNFTPLHSAVEKEQLAAVQLLLARGASKEIACEGDWRPLHIATVNGYETIVEALIAAGADKNAKGKSGTTPLCIATYIGNSTITQILIEAGADAEQEDQRGHTPLSNALAIALQRPAAIKIVYMLLLMGNASLRKRDKLSREAYDLLITLGFDHITFNANLMTSKKLLQKHLKKFVGQLEQYRIPQVIGKLIAEYHTCIDTHILLFTKARFLI